MDFLRLYLKRGYKAYRYITNQTDKEQKQKYERPNKTRDKNHRSAFF